MLSYLANYTHRVAISERRLEAIDAAARTVTFRWRDYREKDRTRALQHCTLDADQVLGRFRRHLLPRGFTKVRHYGLLANNSRRVRVPQARAALAAVTQKKKLQAQTGDGAPEVTIAATGQPCPHCDGTNVVCLALVLPGGRRVPVRPPVAARVEQRKPP